MRTAKIEKEKGVHKRARFLMGLMAISMVAYFAARIINDLNN